VKVSVQAYRRRQKAAVFVALLLFNLMLVLLQLWLFAGVLESLLAGKPTMAIPAAVLSVLIAAVNAWMLDGVYQMDRRA
jgi:hypothetical protein